MIGRAAKGVEVVCASRCGQQHPQPSERLQGLVVELLGPPSPLGLSPRERIAETLPLDATRGYDGCCSACSERFQRLLIIIAKRRRVGTVVEREEHAERLPAICERDCERRFRVIDAELLGCDAQAGPYVVDPLRQASLHHFARG